MKLRYETEETEWGFRAQGEFHREDGPQEIDPEYTQWFLGGQLIYEVDK